MAGSSGRRSPTATTRSSTTCPARHPRRRRAQNWLGTDDQARDVLARIIYGLRISVLFGLLLTLLSSIDRHRRRRGPGLFRRLGRSRLPALHGDLGRHARLLYLLIIMSSFIVPSFWTLLDPDAAVRLDGSGRPRARRVPARAQSRLRPRGPGTGRRQRRASCSATSCPTPWSRRSPSCRSCSAARSPTLTSLDFLGFGLPPGSPSLGELLKPGQEQPAGALARHLRLRRSSRSCCRCWSSSARPSATRSTRARRSAEHGAARGRGSERHLRTRRAGGARASRSRSTAARPWRIVGESGSGKSVTALSILQLLPYPLAAHPSGSIRFDGQELVGRDDALHARHPRPAHRHDLPGADDLAEPAAHRRAADQRGPVRASRPGPGARRGRAPLELLRLVQIPEPRRGSAPTRTSSPAASGSG